MWCVQSQEEPRRIALGSTVTKARTSNVQAPRLCLALAVLEDPTSVPITRLSPYSVAVCIPCRPNIAALPKAFKLMIRPGN